MTKLSSAKGPLYLQIKQIIEDRIIHGIYTVGNYIPTEIEFEKEFDVSKVTVRAAIKELVNLGYVEKKSGKGTTVINHKQADTQTKNKNFTEKLVEQGNKIQKIIKDITVITHEKDSQLFKMFGAQSYKLTRIYLLNDQPYILFNHYLPYPLNTLSDIDKSKENNDLSIYKILEADKLEIQDIEDEFSADFNHAAASQLNLDTNKPLLIRERKSYSVDRAVLEYSIGYYNSELKKYSISLKD
ncbi:MULTISPECIES: GntR family transcriptional regulator [Staphylococcus]|uniref:GntR family transcriptional regulator n=1 Tax=Staphylococcus TaxID=1279 RepID=UPI00028232AA|nr:MULTISPECIES: GntR family transcriptional regulator [Staphylococcus]EJY95117.1 GntR family transcriptional regulator [Staphylococcus arlettae CVD059]KAB2478336.1 GntR family transcriptional regulator [Staphylococcus sp. CH99b_3]MCD8816129.1 GntR family transcriptional regulator [Staphylococcus arlettae]MCD8838583.1 GntR family transcriptional regulator [Staphylococcus arlettae]MCD8866348.1 GntR family transcriptional regulator [Staphylococcus arlettae]